MSYYVSAFLYWYFHHILVYCFLLISYIYNSFIFLLEGDNFLSQIIFKIFCLTLVLKVSVWCFLIGFSLYLHFLVFLEIAEFMDWCLFELWRVFSHYILKYCFSLYSLSSLMTGLNVHRSKDYFTMTKLSPCSFLNAKFSLSL